MKKLNIISFLIIAILFTSCKKYLDLPPKNKRAVETLSDIKSALAGYLDGIKTPNTVPMVGAYPIFTAKQIMMFESYSDNIAFQDNMQHYISNQNIHAQEKVYANYFLWNETETPDNIWANYYTTIGLLNALIDQMDVVTDGAPDERDRVKGEMLVHRAFYIYKLLQYFAPYDQAEMGIPLYLHTGGEVVGVKMARKSHAEVYSVILQDLNEALDLVKRSTPRASFNVFYNERFIANLLAQVYWFKAESPAAEASDYSEAKKHSLKAVENVDGQIPTTTQAINTLAEGKDVTYPAYYQTRSEFGPLSAIYGSSYAYIGFEPNNLTLSPDFFELFADTDIRKAAYFNGNSIADSWPLQSKNVHVLLFKPEEAYLILAEAQYRLGETNAAVATLSKFKQFRNAGSATGLSGEALLQEIVNERRKEFFADTDKRWLDLKRYGNKTISRSVSFFDKSYNLKVAPNGYQYALPIPLSEMQENPNLVPNPGWDPIVY